ncbi:hypothetical protein D3C87_1915060 [compost metagenome]
MAAENGPDFLNQLLRRRTILTNPKFRQRVRRKIAGEDDDGVLEVDLSAFAVR